MGAFTPTHEYLLKTAKEQKAPLIHVMAYTLEQEAYLLKTTEYPDSHVQVLVVLTEQGKFPNIGGVPDPYRLDLPLDHVRESDQEIALDAKLILPMWVELWEDNAGGLYLYAENTDLVFRCSPFMKLPTAFDNEARFIAEHEEEARLNWSEEWVFPYSEEIFAHPETIHIATWYSDGRPYVLHHRPGGAGQAYLELDDEEAIEQKLEESKKRQSFTFPGAQYSLLLAWYYRRLETVWAEVQRIVTNERPGIAQWRAGELAAARLAVMISEQYTQLEQDTKAHVRGKSADWEGDNTTQFYDALQFDEKLENYRLLLQGYSGSRAMLLDEQDYREKRY